MEWIKTYNLTELEKLEWITMETMKKRKTEYIPIFFKNWQSAWNFRRGKTKNPYSVKYIRRKDLDNYLKENGENIQPRATFKARNRKSFKCD